MGNLTTYLKSCIWLWVPPLVASFIFWPNLGAAYQPDEFWREIPWTLGVIENFTRVALIVLSMFMVLDWRTRPQRIGLFIYAIGLMLYVACQWVIVLEPDGWWANSAVGFLAPAYTPLVWMVGIGLIGGQTMVPHLPWRRWYFAAVAGLFLSAHFTHAFLVFSRLD